MALTKFNEVRDEIKGYLPQYLAKFGIDAREKRKFRCISPTHQDTHPSSNIVPGLAIYHCHSCGVTGDIFDAANAKENKPLSGRAFITDNLMYLAKMFNVTMPEVDISDEEMFEVDARRAYAHASRILTQTKKRSEIVSSKLAEYGWSDDILFKIGIGSIESYDDYIQKMTKVHGHTLAFLESIDLTRKSIFRNSNLIYTIRDPHGSPIAFSARNLRFEGEMADFRQKEAAINADQSLPVEERKDKIDLLYKPRKYTNTMDTPLFHKGEVLFNFDQAKLSATKTLTVFEGNADGITLFAGGMKTAVATCGTAFTIEHLDMAISYGITKVVLVFDPDKAGKEGTEKFIATLEKFGGRPGLEVEIVAMPGTSDPDAYVRAFGADLKVGVAEFRKLPRIDLMTWKLKKLIQEGADPYVIVNETLPLIVNVENNIERLQRADRLAAATGLPEAFLQRELLRLLDANESKSEEERNAIVQQTAKALQQNPMNADLILANAQTKLENVAGSRVGYDPRINLKAAQLTFEKLEAATDMFELVTGFPIFDSLMGGIPKEGVMMSLPGKPHHGKSIYLDNLVVGVLRNNPNAQVFLHHVDDAALLRIPRLLGVMSGLSSRDIQKAGAALETLGPAFETRFREAQDEFLGWVSEERLILADQSALINDLAAHERWIKEIRLRHPKRHLIAMGDNFHLFDMPGDLADEAKVRQMSKFIAGLPVKHGITTMFTMELPKEILRPGVRPKYTDSKGSGGIAFDSKVNMGVYQELQDLGADSTLIWHSPDHMEQITAPDSTTAYREKDLPIVEIIVDKNKATGLKKVIFFRLEPMSGRMEECSTSEQFALQAALEEAAKARRSSQKQTSPSFAPRHPF
jgi:DNA primase